MYQMFIISKQMACYKHAMPYDYPLHEAKF